MANVSIVVEDKVISVDGDGRVGEYTFPANLWAMQLKGNEGQAECGKRMLQNQRQNQRLKK